ncbi:hypothetical protein BVG79_p1000170 (plasmid) [Ketogulonicigenium robustum]|uniref:Uncharacterized protein n=1 Tax=Ketogulonicigenium robustum TaxID=92947 RepID=A0A1W6P396_9RHOB|nr:hypothetical protein BVG79_p1000170 [Ketogulonicigenium robustum]
MKVFSSRGIGAAYEAMGPAAAQQFNELLEGAREKKILC